MAKKSIKEKLSSFFNKLYESASKKIHNVEQRRYEKRQLSTSKKSPLFNKKGREIAFIISFLIFPIVQFIIFWIIVNFKSILMAFSDATGKLDGGLSNWNYFVKEWNGDARSIQVSIKNSFIYFGVSNFILLPLTVVFAYLLYKRCVGHAAFRVIFFLPSIIGGVVYCTLFRFFVGVLGSAQGPLLKAYTVLCDMFNKEVPELVLRQGLFGSSETAFATIMVELLWTGMGIGLILMAGGLSRIPKEIFESAKIDGVNMWQEFWHIVVPLLLPTINSVFTLGMAGMFTFYMPIMLMTEGAADTSTIGWYMNRFVLDRAKKGGNLNYPAFVGILTTVVAIPIVLSLRKIVDKLTPDVSY